MTQKNLPTKPKEPRGRNLRLATGQRHVHPAGYYPTFANAVEMWDLMSQQPLPKNRISVSRVRLVIKGESRLSTMRSKAAYSIRNVFSLCETSLAIFGRCGRNRDGKLKTVPFEVSQRPAGFQPPCKRQETTTAAASLHRSRKRVVETRRGSHGCYKLIATPFRALRESDDRSPKLHKAHDGVGSWPRLSECMARAYHLLHHGSSLLVARWPARSQSPGQALDHYTHRSVRRRRKTHLERSPKPDTTNPHSSNTSRQS